MRTAPTILVADDDPDDRLLARDAWSECGPTDNLHFVADGEELLDYLLQRGAYAAPGVAPRPELILLDLNMPKQDGREALRAIKADPHLRSIPVVILTTSQADEDVARAYDLGVSSYITKPPAFGRLVDIMRSLHVYWFSTVRLPPFKSRYQ